MTKYSRKFRKTHLQYTCSCNRVQRCHQVCQFLRRPTLSFQRQIWRFPVDKKGIIRSFSIYMYIWTMDRQWCPRERRISLRGLSMASFTWKDHSNPLKPPSGVFPRTSLTVHSEYTINSSFVKKTKAQKLNTFFTCRFLVGNGSRWIQSSTFWASSLDDPTKHL